MRDEQTKHMIEALFRVYSIGRFVKPKVDKYYNSDKEYENDYHTPKLRIIATLYDTADVFCALGATFEGEIKERYFYAQLQQSNYFQARELDTEVNAVLHMFASFVIDASYTQITTDQYDAMSVDDQMSYNAICKIEGVINDLLDSE